MCEANTSDESTKFLLLPGDKGMVTNEPRHEKINIVDFDQVWHKPGCTATGDG